ncbi:MAG TPA: AAA family ATPase [Planctomycetaceae bacterium]|nr:AAA family ATPase [Planctomycetaceae bacterium]
MPLIDKKKKLGLAAYLKSKRKPGSDVVTIGGSDADPVEEFETASMADVMKRVAGIRYLVKDWIPHGMATMLVAEPGVGKSAFALFGLVRPIIMDANWFNGTKGPPKRSNVLWCDTEGTAAITVQRLHDWGRPPERIKVPFADDPLRPINLTDPKHLQRIEDAVNNYKTPLVVIDSLRGAHDGDENSSGVTKVLQSLGGIAERTSAAIVIIHHTRKLQFDEDLTANSSRGSNAILAMVRSQMGIDKPDKTGEWCRLQMLKENLGIKPNPIGFRISTKGIEFGLAPAKPRTETQRDKAEDWLRANMKPGVWHSAGTLTADAEDDGFSETALRRARNILGIIKPDHVRKVKDGWQWMLPALGGEKVVSKLSKSGAVKTAAKTVG